MKSNFDGNIYFCVVPHGTKEYVCEKMDEYCTKLQIRVNYIQHLKNEFIKFNICKKFYMYGKMMYIYRTVKCYNEWIDKLQQVHNYLEDLALNDV